MGRGNDVGVFSVVVAQVVFAVKIEPEHVLQLEGSAPDLGRGRQAIIETNDLQVGIVLDISGGLGLQQ